MKRSGFKRPERKPAPRVPLLGRHQPKPRPVAEPLRVSDGTARMVVPLPKAPRAKPGKRAPMKREAEWMTAITSYGCIVCRRQGRGFVPAAVHHLLRGGQRIGHLHSIPLCDPGHHQGATAGSGEVSRHPNKTRFEAAYGTEAELLAAVRAAINWTGE
ncbi:MAG: hypothetical protein IIZ92_15610 [Aquincola sp.]|nr:hypothetical protein [Aquincola sp.]